MCLINELMAVGPVAQRVRGATEVCQCAKPGSVTDKETLKHGDHKFRNVSPCILIDILHMEGRIIKEKT